MEKDTDTFGSLPAEVVEVICEYCDDRALLERLPRVAKVFSAIISNDKFWRRRCDTQNVRFIAKEDTKSWRYNYQKNLQYFPYVPWSDIIGHEEIKERLREGILLPIKFPQLFKAGHRRSRTILLYGPPGPEKLEITKAVATESKLPLFRFSCADLYGIWRGEGEKKLREFFQEAKKHAPAVLFVEDVDRVDGFLERDNEGEASRRLKVEFLIQMEQRDPNVYVIATTERPWDICPAVRRRLEQRLLVDFPNLDARVKIFKQHLAPVLRDVTDEDFIEVSRLASNYTAYDIYDVVRSAPMIPLRALVDATHFKPITLPCQENPSQSREYMIPCSPGDAEGSPLTFKEVPKEKLVVPRVTKRHLELALTLNKPSTTKLELDKFEEFTKSYA